MNQEMLRVVIDSLHRSQHMGPLYSRAEAVVNDLQTAGYAVVELPEPTIVPTGWREDCVGCWPSGIGERAFEDPVSAWPGNEGISLPNGDFMSADRARVFAAGLLAAADAAEANE